MKSLSDELIEEIEKDIRETQELNEGWLKLDLHYRRRLLIKWKNQIQRALDTIRSLF